jgi:glycine oxidase
MQQNTNREAHHAHPRKSSTTKTVNFLIVGQGLAGSLLFWELHQRGYSVAVVDEGLPHTSSKIAAGMFNPINTKRFTVSANATVVIPEAISVYTSMEKQLGISIVHHQSIYNVFGNHKEANDYTTKLDHPFFKQYTNGQPNPEDHINQPYGAFEVGLSGWIDLKTMLASLRLFIQQNHLLQTERLHYELLEQQNEKWHYQDIVADTVVFCEGFQANGNPYFPNMNIIPCKGDVLEFEAPLLHPTRVIKKGIYIVPLGQGKFRCGSTYQWENANTAPMASDKAALSQKIAELIDVPFTITAHHVAIRPTTKTRETIITKHETLPNMYALNGLGTKGVINGVRCVKEFLEHIT